MNRTAPLVVVLALSLFTAGRPASASPPAATVVDWNQILQDTLPPSEGVQTPRYYAMMHIAMFDAVNALEREFAALSREVPVRRGADRRKPRRPRRRTTCSWRSTRRRRQSTTRRSPRTSASPRPVSCAAGRRLAQGWPSRCWRGGRATAGSFRRSRPTPSRCCRAAGNRLRRQTPRQHSPIFSTRHRWRCFPRRSTCRIRRRR